MQGREVCDYFFFNDTATTEIYTLSLHDALPIAISRSARLSPCSRRMRSRRSRIAVVTANVIVSPVRSASSRARRCVSSSLMLRRIFGGPSISAEYTRAADRHKIGGAPGGLPPNAPYHASRPVSRVLYGAKQATHLARDGHSSGTPVARRLEQPTRAADPDIDPGISPRAAPIRSCSRWGLPCRLRRRRRGALLPHRFTLAAGFSPRGGLRFLWHFPWGHPRRTLSGTACPWSPDFPPRRPFRSLPGRPS